MNLENQNNFIIKIFNIDSWGQRFEISSVIYSTDR